MEMGKYCKAYYAKDFRQFPDWTEDLHNLRRDTRVEDGKEGEIERDELQDEDILYLQENYVVTDGIMKDEYIIFDKVTDDWKEFCHGQLEFEIPVDESIEIKLPEDDEGEQET